MAIIRKPERPQTLRMNHDDEVPFVIDWELVERARNTPTPELIVAIGTALHGMVPDDSATHVSLWQSASRIEQISRRVPRGRK